MIDIKRDIQDIKRFKEILGVLFEEGFSALLHNSKLSRFVPLHKKLVKSDASSRNEVRLRRTLEQLGPTFIKLGQVLSVRPDLVPKNYIKELEKLQDEVPSFDFKQVKNCIEKSLGKKWTQIFRKIDEKPVASASIAQVHKAILKDGSKVALKVKRPNVEETVEKDLEIMMFIAKLLEKRIKPIKKYKPVGIVNEFAGWTRREIDFTIEAENMRIFYNNFKNSKTTKIPKVYMDYCSRDLIVMEFVNGVELNRIGRRKNIKKSLQNGFYSILEQVFVHGIFHGDPHPSNILILKDERIGFVDFGIVGRFDDALKDLSVNILLAISEGSASRVIENLIDMGSIKDTSKLDELKEKIRYIILPLKSGSLQDIKISKLLEEILDTALHYGIKIPAEFVLFGKTLVTLEGTALLYYPDFRFIEMIKPFLEELLLKRYQPKNLAKRSLRNLIKLRKVATKLPEQTLRVLDKLEQGKIQLEMKDTDISNLSVGIDRSSNRLTYGMIIAALLISGSLVINVGERVLYGLPPVGLMLFSAAFIISLVLIISIVKERNH